MPRWRGLVPVPFILSPDGILISVYLCQDGLTVSRGYDIGFAKKVVLSVATHDALRNTTQAIDKSVPSVERPPTASSIFGKHSVAPTCQDGIEDSLKVEETPYGQRLNHSRLPAIGWPRHWVAQVEAEPTTAWRASDFMHCSKRKSCCIPGSVVKTPRRVVTDQAVTRR